MLATRLVAFAKTTVRFNGLDVPFNTAITSVARYCRPFAFHNDGSDFELSMAGSAFAVRVLGQNVLIASRHQLGTGAHARDGAEVVIILGQGEGTVAITGNAIFRARMGIENALVDQDVFIVRFDDQRDGRDLKPLFCRLAIDQFTDRSAIPEGSKVLANILIGFPTRHQIYDTEWDEQTSTHLPGEIRSRWVKVYLDPAEPDVWDVKGLVPFQIDREQVAAIGDPDGLSGSPILMLWQAPDQQVHLSIAGMVLRASKMGRINAYPGGGLNGILSRLAELERRSKS